MVDGDWLDTFLQEKVAKCPKCGAYIKVVVGRLELHSPFLKADLAMRYLRTTGIPNCPGTGEYVEAEAIMTYEQSSQQPDRHDYRIPDGYPPPGELKP